ncbi:MAG: 50S ribosomal protein L11 methyltransferase [Ginsengibacter sp.]
MKKYIKIDIQTATPEQADILIASMSDQHYYAFEQEGNKLVAYITEEDFDENALNELVNNQDIISKSIIDDTNWNKQWESDFKPVRIGDFAVIRAAFHEQPQEVKHDLLITPKMSFGTGHHATTWLMVAQMEHINFKNKKVLDFGTGTGVLAILAEKLGASQVMAIDLDEWSINNTLENAETNNCTKINVELRDNLEGLESAEVILANINLNILNQFSASISGLQEVGGALLVSGFLSGDAETITTIFAEKNYMKKKQMDRENWVSILFEKKSS